MNVLFVDNIDSFAYNVVHLLASAGAPPEVMVNDDPRLQPQIAGEYDAIVIGPGPGTPADYPQMLAVLTAAMDAGRPVLGVCLGLQAIGHVLGGRIVRAPRPMHGKVSQIAHGAVGLFEGLPSPLTATRYHSLCIEPASLPEALRVTARSDDEVIQAVEHRSAPVHAVQFHPESILSEHGERMAGNFLRIAKETRLNRR